MRVRPRWRSCGPGHAQRWSPALRWQLRLRALLSVGTAGTAVVERWQRLKFTAAARDYLSPLAPGASLDTPAGADGEHFAIVTAQVLAIDWLELGADKHKRAACDEGGARWLQP